MSTLEHELADWNKRFGDDNGKMTIPSMSGKEPCRHEPTLIFSAQGVKFFGASVGKLNSKTLAAVNADLLINLTGASLYKYRQQPIDGPLIKSAPRWFAKLFAQPKVEEVVIDWPDYGTIPAGPDFFETIWKAIKEKKKKNIVVFCVGGHGRTGTCAGSLMTVIKSIHGGHAIRRVRETYCSHAIETKPQEEMVRRMTQRTVDKKGGAAACK
jgi:protein-tyrosine phosphatase